MAKATATASAEPNKVHPQEPGVPKWSLILGGLFVAIGALLFLTKDARERRDLIEDLSEAELQVSPSEDGFAADFGDMTIQSKRSELLHVLGMCYSKPDQALAVFKGLMEDNSRKEGRALGCRIGYSLIQDPGLAMDQKMDVLNTMGQQLAETASADVRRVAQVWISELLVITDLEHKDTFVKVPAPKEKTDKIFEAKTVEFEIGESKILYIHWSNPDACLAWWEKFGKNLKWDVKLKRFVVSVADE